MEDKGKGCNIKLPFSLKLEKPEIIGILGSLEKFCSVLPLEFNEDGLFVDVGDDSKNMAFRFVFKPSMLGEFAFTGDESERYAVSSQNFFNVMKRISYPVEISSTLDGIIKIVSPKGRQTYRIKILDDDYSDVSDRVRKHLTALYDAEDGLEISVMRQDLKDGLKNVAVAGNGVTIEVAEDRLELSTKGIELEAEAEVLLIEAVDGSWKKDYNVKLFQSVLNVVGGNIAVEIILFSDNRSFVAKLKLDDDGSFCCLTLAPLTAGRQKEEEGSSEDESSVD